MKSRKFLALAISGLTLIGIIVISTQLFAQTPLPTPDSTAIIQTTTAVAIRPLSPEALEGMHMTATFGALSLTSDQTTPSTRRFSHPIRIVYLVNTDAVPADSFLSGANMQAQLSYSASWTNMEGQTATTWEHVLQLDTEKRIDVLIVHPSAYAMVDRAWAAAAARSGVVFALLNMEYVQLAELQGNTCALRALARDSTASQGNLVSYLSASAGSNFYVASFISIRADSDIEQALAVTAFFDTCQQPTMLNERVRFAGFVNGGYTGEIFSEVDFHRFFNSLVDFALDSRNISNRAFP